MPLSYRCREFLYIRRSFSYSDAADKSLYYRNQKQIAGLSSPDILSRPSDQKLSHPKFQDLPRSHPYLPVLFPSPGTDRCQDLPSILLPMHFLRPPESHNTLQIHENDQCARYRIIQDFSSYAESTICIRFFSVFSSHTTDCPTSGRPLKMHPGDSLQ